MRDLILAACAAIVMEPKSWPKKHHFAKKKEPICVWRVEDERNNGDTRLEVEFLAGRWRHGLTGFDPDTILARLSTIEHDSGFVLRAGLKKRRNGWEEFNGKFLDVICKIHKIRKKMV